MGNNKTKPKEEWKPTYNNTKLYQEVQFVITGIPGYLRCEHWKRSCLNIVGPQTRNGEWVDRVHLCDSCFCLYQKDNARTMETELHQKQILDLKNEIDAMRSLLVNK